MPESAGLPRARKRFGQHFLEPVWAEKVLAALSPEESDTFLEIGPGRGALTLPLAQRTRQVIAFEIDRDLAQHLRHVAPPNVRVITTDFLDVTADCLGEEISAIGAAADRIRAAGNLPYNVASPILFKLVELAGAGAGLTDASVMLQREVADRLLARPGTRDYGVLTVLIGHSAAGERLLQLPAGAFRPAPKVQSTVVRLRFHAPSPPVKSPAVFAGVTQAIFTRRRKTLANALRAYPPAVAAGPLRALAAADIHPQRRPETLTIAELARLADVLFIRGNP